MMNKKLIAERLKALRGKKSSFIVAQECNISRSALAMYESGARVPTDEIKIRLARYYGVTVGQLFYE